MGFDKFIYAGYVYSVAVSEVIINGMSLVLTRLCKGPMTVPCIFPLLANFLSFIPCGIRFSKGTPILTAILSTLAGELLEIIHIMCFLSTLLKGKSQVSGRSVSLAHPIRSAGKANTMEGEASTPSSSPGEEGRRGSLYSWLLLTWFISSRGSAASACHFNTASVSFIFHQKQELWSGLDLALCRGQWRAG